MKQKKKIWHYTLPVQLSESSGSMSIFFITTKVPIHWIIATTIAKPSDTLSVKHNMEHQDLFIHCHHWLHSSHSEGHTPQNTLNCTLKLDVWYCVSHTSCQTSSRTLWCLDTIYYYKRTYPRTSTVLCRKLKLTMSLLFTVCSAPTRT